MNKTRGVGMLALAKYRMSDKGVRAAKLTDSHFTTGDELLVLSQNGTSRVTYIERYPVPGRIWHDSWVHFIRSGLPRFPDLNGELQPWSYNGHILYLRSREEVDMVLDKYQYSIRREDLEEYFNLILDRQIFRRAWKFGLPLAQKGWMNESYFQNIPTVSLTGVYYDYKDPYGNNHDYRNLPVPFIDASGCRMESWRRKDEDQEGYPVHISEEIPEGIHIPPEWHMSLGGTVFVYKTTYEGIPGYIAPDGRFIPEGNSFLTPIEYAPRPEAPCEATATV